MLTGGDVAGMAASLTAGEFTAGVAMALGVGGAISGNAGKCSLLMLGAADCSEAGRCADAGGGGDVLGIGLLAALAVDAVVKAGVGEG